MSPLPEPVASLFAFAFGAVFGSFLNVCIHRLPQGLSLVRPGSRCPACEAAIPWYRNVPIVSWIALRGRCASCAAPISWRYPFVELLGGGIVLVAWQAFGPTPAFAIFVPFALAMVVLFFTDLDHRILPDPVTLSGFAVGVAVAWWNPFLGEPGWGRLWDSVAGAALGSGLLWGIGALWSRLRGVEAMGLGDVKMMAMVGAFSGPTGVLFTLFVGSVAGAVVGTALVPLRGRTMQDTLPFGCFLAPAAVAALVLAGPAFRAYLGLVGLGG